MPAMVLSDRGHAWDTLSGMADRRGLRRWAHIALRPSALLMALVVLVGSAGLAPSHATRAAADELVTTSVSGSPFRGGTGSRARVTLRVHLAERARLRVEVVRFRGSRVRLLERVVRRDAGTWTYRWDGRGADGRLLPDGPYRFRVAATAGDADTVIDERWVTKAPAVPPVPARGSIIVAINPGHGGDDPGATSEGLEEADVNLDIALRVGRMLEAAGVTVVMTRTSDRAVNRPEVDVDGNGRIDHRDELIARLDVANLARADLTLNGHHNATSCHCVAGTQTFVDRRRPWGSLNASLGRAVQAAFIRRLRKFEDRSWHVRDRGLGSGSYVSLSGGGTGGSRPSLMPAVLGEPLFIDHRRERRLLRSSTVRTAIAAAYYDAVVAWLRQRRVAVHYSRLAVPATVEAGSRATVGVRLRATGTQSLEGWRLEARLVRALPVLDGSGTHGRLVGSVRVDRLAPGRARDLSMRITLPEDARDWLLKLDLVRGDTRLSRRGVVQPQRLISTVVP
jgi:N-acetylmuramoyl-L-alanine amidase